ncbi:MAG: hypothetical protein CFE24_00165 [Flavobacterium sp. BFFFF2]|nr:MAG: hypothetical protein CFE24_00165 [Flavobacterium sp. BFFFF2]
MIFLALILCKKVNLFFTFAVMIKPFKNQLLITDNQCCTSLNRGFTNCNLFCVSISFDQSIEWLQYAPKKLPIIYANIRV